MNAATVTCLNEVVQELFSGDLGSVRVPTVLSDSEKCCRIDSGRQYRSPVVPRKQKDCDGRACLFLGGYDVLQSNALMFIQLRLAQVLMVVGMELAKCRRRDCGSCGRSEEEEC